MRPQNHGLKGASKDTGVPVNKKNAQPLLRRLGVEVSVETLKATTLSTAEEAISYFQNLAIWFSLVYR